jgi:hypothetical protein
LGCAAETYASLDLTECDASSTVSAFQDTCCSKCTAGTSSQPGWSSCCGAGTTYASNVCVECAARKFGTSLGSTSCQLCSERTASFTTGRKTPCDNCKSGQYGPSKGAINCLRCPPKLYSLEAWSWCCRVGQVLGTNTSSCVCDKGYQPADASMTHCKKCDISFFKETQTKEFCITCCGVSRRARGH